MMRPPVIPRALTIWNSALPASLLLIIGIDWFAGVGVSAGSPLDYPAWLLTLMYAVTTPVTTLLGAHFCGRVGLPRLRSLNRLLFLIWLVLLGTTFVIH